MQRLPFPHLVAQRYEHGELQAAVSGVVQNDVPDELQQKRDSPPTNSRKHLGMKRYEPVWASGTQTPQGDGNRDARYTLEMIELDEGYFSVASKEIERGKGTRAGEPRESRTLR